MPAIGATDPANLMAQARRESGLSCQLELEQRWRTLPHLSKEDTTGYTTWYREEQLTKHQNNEPVEVSEASISRWNHHLNAHRWVGNCDHPKFVGINMINLVVSIIAHPDALLGEMAVSVYNIGGCYTINRQSPNVWRSWRSRKRRHLRRPTKHWHHPTNSEWKSFLIAHLRLACLEFHDTNWLILMDLPLRWRSATGLVGGLWCAIGYGRTGTIR